MTPSVGIVLRFLPIVVLAAATGCGGDDGPSAGAGGGSGGASGSGQGGSPPQPPSAGASGASSILVPSACIFNEGGDPEPSIERLDASTVDVPCDGRIRASLLSISNLRGQGFDFRVDVEPPSEFFSPDPPTGSACPGFFAIQVGVIAIAPQDAQPGDTADAVVRMTTSDDRIEPITAEVHSRVVATDVSLDRAVVDFGDVAVGAFEEIAVVVTNHGTTPLEALYAKPTLVLPFTQTDWGPHGEDVFEQVPLPPGESGEMILFGFLPSEPGPASVQLELSPFAGSRPVSPDCGASIPLQLRGRGVVAIPDAGVAADGSAGTP